ncbi:hypothetical protein BZK28_05930 [Helicobacter pylori]|nr:hypothetical protein BZK28_05930 [Helicobacter pylori]
MQLVISVICIESFSQSKIAPISTPFISPFFLLREIIAQILVKNDLKRDNCKVLKISFFD